MPAQDSIDAMNTQMDVASLYREEVVTDRKVGTIHVLTPILDSGERDTSAPLPRRHADHDPDGSAADFL